MDKKILASLLMIGILAAVLGGVTYAVFSDTETSVDNTMTAGTIDFMVDNQNPWIKTYSECLADMKPCEVNYIEFTITNDDRDGANPMNIWKRINITEEDGGVGIQELSGASSEPEYVEGGGLYDECGPIGDEYIERCNLAAYTLYDMNVTIDEGPEKTIINHANQVRLDNVNGVWIYLGELKRGETMVVNQSYHLSAWDDALEDEVTNWAQGDVLTFDIELYGEQLTGDGPNADVMMVELVGKNPITWSIVPGANGTLFYNTAGPEFVYDFTGVGLDADTDYSLIYYADPWTGNHPGALITNGTSTTSGALGMVGSIDLGMDLPHEDDANYPGGAKIWLVLSSDYDADNTKMTGWTPSTCLFEMNLIQYTDTGKV